MVEAVCVISVFILFFVGMVYFESLYHEQLHVQQLARAGAVAYAMDACNDTNSLQTVQQDLGTANGQNGTPVTGTPATVSVAKPNKPIGNQGSDPLGSALGSKGFFGDKVTDITINGKAAGTSKNGPFAERTGFRSDVASNSYMSCGDKQEAGGAGAFIDMVKGVFK
jgi:hypothetical protein